ncbi:hypothetical protein B0H13DRAFT_2652144 [Mycena leptocephala]|nr:hypothetical protein B0H13DRAFT_2652144 [Mycena leptocephala]
MPPLCARSLAPATPPPRLLISGDEVINSDATRPVRTSYRRGRPSAAAVLTATLTTTLTTWMARLSLSGPSDSPLHPPHPHRPIQGPATSLRVPYLRRCRARAPGAYHPAPFVPILARSTMYR